MKILKFLIVLLFFISCREDIDTNNIIGTWKLTQQLVDPGDGSGKFIPVNSEKTVTFKTNGTYSSNGSFCIMSIQANENSTGNYTYTSNEKKLKPQCITIGLQLSPIHNLRLENGNLIISGFGCIESCEQKFIKIRD